MFFGLAKLFTSATLC